MAAVGLELSDEFILLTAQSSLQSRSGQVEQNIQSQRIWDNSNKLVLFTVRDAKKHDTYYFKLIDTDTVQ